MSQGVSGIKTMDIEARVMKRNLYIVCMMSYYYMTKQEDIQDQIKISKAKNVSLMVKEQTSETG